MRIAVPQWKETGKPNECDKSNDKGDVDDITPLFHSNIEISITFVFIFAWIFSALLLLHSAKRKCAHLELWSVKFFTFLAVPFPFFFLVEKGRKYVLCLHYVNQRSTRQPCWDEKNLSKYLNNASRSITSQSSHIVNEFRTHSNYAPNPIDPLPYHPLALHSSPLIWITVLSHCACSACTVDWFFPVHFDWPC